MFGLRQSHPSVVSSSQSWFALKKEEFYVILDTVLTEMTSQCAEEHRDVTGCMELIKLLSDNDANSREVGAKNAQIGSSSNNNNNTNIGAKVEPELVKRQAEVVVVGGKRFRSRGLEVTSGRRDDRSGFDRSARSADENLQLSDTRRNCVKPKSEDRSCSERRKCLRRSNGGSQNLEPNRICGTSNRTPKCTDLDAKTSCKSTSPSCLCLKRPLLTADAAKTTRDWTHRSCDQPCDQSRDRRRDVSKSVSGQNLNLMTTLCVPSPPIRFYGRTRRRAAVGVPSITRLASFEVAPKQKLRSQNRADDGGKISDEISDPLERENYVWTAVDKSVINGIVDSILLGPPGVKKSRVTHDAAAAVAADVCKRVKLSDDAPPALGVKSRVKTEDVVVVKSDDFVTPRAVGNRHDDVADVKLVDVTRFDVTEMGFKWKSKLLWRMNRDRASRVYPSKLCMT